MNERMNKLELAMERTIDQAGIRKKIANEQKERVRKWKEKVGLNEGDNEEEVEADREKEDKREKVDERNRARKKVVEDNEDDGQDDSLGNSHSSYSTNWAKQLTGQLSYDAMEMEGLEKKRKNVEK